MVLLGGGRSPSTGWNTRGRVARTAGLSWPAVGGGASAGLYPYPGYRGTGASDGARGVAVRLSQVREAVNPRTGPERCNGGPATFWHTGAERSECAERRVPVSLSLADWLAHPWLSSPWLSSWRRRSSSRSRSASCTAARAGPRRRRRGLGRRPAGPSIPAALAAGLGSPGRRSAIARRPSTGGAPVLRCSPGSLLPVPGSAGWARRRRPPSGGRPGGVMIVPPVWSKRQYFLAPRAA